MDAFSVPRELKKRDTYIARIKPFINKNLIKFYLGNAVSVEVICCIS